VPVVPLEDLSLDIGLLAHQDRCPRIQRRNSCWVRGNTGKVAEIVLIGQALFMNSQNIRPSRFCAVWF